jgi:hypothetical protein
MLNATVNSNHFLLRGEFAQDHDYVVIRWKDIGPERRRAGFAPVNFGLSVVRGTMYEVNS